MRSLGVVLVVTGVFASACGSDGGGDSFDSPEALAEELGCADSYEVKKSDEDTIDLDLPTFGVEEGECAIDGETFSLSVYPSSDDADQALNQVETIGCSFAAAFGVSEINIARGGNWFVSLADGDGGSGERELLEPVADRLGESVQRIECDAP